MGNGEKNEDLANNEAFTKVHFDFEHLPYLTNPRSQLKTHAVALGLIQLPPGEGYTFTHSHAQQEEVYIVIEGQGTMLIDGELIARNTQTLQDVEFKFKRQYLKTAPKNQ